MTITEPEALEAMLAHHRALEEGVRARVDHFVAAATRGDDPGRSAGALVAFLASEVIPHAQAEEQTVYRAAGAHGALVETLRQMVDEHRMLVAATGRLAESPGSSGAATEAEQLALLFSSHVAKENAVLLPVLAADATADLAGLVAEMHRLMEAARRAAESSDEPSSDPTAAILSVLLKATTALSRAGEADQACRLAAAAWAALREPRPELAVRVTAALHGLARRVAPEPVTLASSGRPVGGAEADTELDVRSLAPAQRHHVIFESYEKLAPGTGFVLINDHDPKPLGYQFEAEHAGQYTWEYLEAGPTVWRVRIGRPAASESAAPARAGLENGTLPELDVRAMPHGRRHDSIFAAYLALCPGAGFALVNDHDPRPLSYQFDARFPGQYTWDYLEAGPEVWRVRIGRPGR
ncbi:MAG: DUF2249 domain-containing protein [Acidimicrobiaceae bacterium]|nr:DUF2249 domain-containing protein [Acidimicrobiaceae bacterium]